MVGAGAGKSMPRIVRWAALALLAVAAVCNAQEPPGVVTSALCSRIPQSPPSYAARIAQVACAENVLWHSPFIDAQGRLASITVSESERLRLRDGATPAWQRVADYWKGSGLLAQMNHFPGATDCSFAPAGGHLQAASCRAFLIDTPWSAAFVSFVMVRAGVPGFPVSASHIDFVREAYANPGSSPYALVDPDATPPSAGDLLCFARGNGAMGAQGLRSFLAQQPGNGLNMHCDIVVAADAKEGHVYLVGGNVLQGVTLRVLPLNRNGAIWGLPRRMADPTLCNPVNESACSFNRQDWVALLKLRSLPAPAGQVALPTQRSQQCCTRCPLPMPAGLKRCPVGQRPVDERVQP